MRGGRCPFERTVRLPGSIAPSSPVHADPVARVLVPWFRPERPSQTTSWGGRPLDSFRATAPSPDCSELRPGRWLRRRVRCPDHADRSPSTRVPPRPGLTRRRRSSLLRTSPRPTPRLPGSPTEMAGDVPAPIPLRFGVAEACALRNRHQSTPSKTPGQHLFSKTQACPQTFSVIPEDSPSVHRLSTGTRLSCTGSAQGRAHLARLQFAVRDGRYDGRTSSHTRPRAHRIVRRRWSSRGCARVRRDGDVQGVGIHRSHLP